MKDAKKKRKIEDNDLCLDCPHPAHKGNCPLCSVGDMCNPHPKGSSLPGWKKL